MIKARSTKMEPKTSVLKTLLLSIRSVTYGEIHTTNKLDHILVSCSSQDLDII